MEYNNPYWKDWLSEYGAAVTLLLAALALILSFVGCNSYPTTTLPRNCEFQLRQPHIVDPYLRLAKNKPYSNGGVGDRHFEKATEEYEIAQVAVECGPGWLHNPEVIAFIEAYWSELIADEYARQRMP